MKKSKRQINIGVCKIGKSMLFIRKKWGIIGGDYETAKFIISFAEMNPNIHFWLVGRNDWIKLDEELKDNYNINNNIHNVWDYYDKNTFNQNRIYWPDYFLRENNIELDLVWAFSGPSTYISLKDTVINKKTGKYYKTLMFTDNYITPITILLNNRPELNWIEFGEDGRYFPNKIKDLLNLPELVLSTRDYKAKPFERYIDDSFDEKKETNVPIINGYADRFIVIGEDIPHNDYDFNKRTNLMSIYSNGVKGAIAEKKYKIIKKDLFENIDNDEIVVYGRWDKTDKDTVIEQKYLDRFKNVPMISLVDQMKNTKYTYMFPAERGWNSSKFWKMIYFGIIPFFHFTMDTDKTQPLPDFLRVNDKNDLKEKIEYLENNDEARKDIFETLQLKLKDSYFNGEYYNNIFLNVINCVSNTVNSDTYKYLKNNVKPLKNNKIKILTED